MSEGVFIQVRICPVSRETAVVMTAAKRTARRMLFA